LKERIAETEQISKRRLIEELAKLQALARVELDQRMRKEQQTLDRVRQEAAVVEVRFLGINPSCSCTNQVDVLCLLVDEAHDRSCDFEKATRGSRSWCDGNRKATTE